MACIHIPESTFRYLYGLFIFQEKPAYFYSMTVCISSILLLPFKNLVRNEKYGSYEADMELPVQS